MKREGQTRARQRALKVLVPIIHFFAATWEKVDSELSLELRALADRMNELGERGSPATLALFWEG